MHLANSPTEIECGKCHSILPLDAFYLSAKTYAQKRAGKVIRPRYAPRGKRASQCKDCKKVYDRAWRAKQDPATKKQRATDAYLRDRESRTHSFRGSCSRARLAGAAVTLTIEDWCALQAEIACHWCGLALHESFRNIDHIVPLVEGGEHSKSNLVSACANCNMRREWERKTARLRKGASQ